jgi:antitoxin component of RelBE/YafQ-DinJ toxin-antitoxin module
MKNASIYFKVEQDIKRKAQKKAADLGVSLSDVLNNYLRRFLKTKSIEFVGEDEELVPTVYLKRLLKQSEKDKKAGKVRSFKNFAEEEAFLKKIIANGQSSHKD